MDKLSELVALRQQYEHALAQINKEIEAFIANAEAQIASARRQAAA